jgi:large subunit ribosomal protein L31e
MENQKNQGLGEADLMKEESEVKEKKTGESEEAEPTEKAVEETAEAEETLEKEEEAEEEREVEEELPPVEEEEIKPPARKEVEEEIVEEKFYTISLGKAWIAVPKKRAPRAMKMIRDFVKRHMKFEARGELEEEEEEEPKRLVISNEVNKRVWRRGIQKPPREVRVRAAKDKDGNVTVYLAEGE